MTDTMTPIIPTPISTISLKRRFWQTWRGNNRTRQAITLREQGHTYQEIADRLGYADRMSAHWAVNRSVIAQEMRGKAIEIVTTPRNHEKSHPPTHDDNIVRTGEMSDPEQEAA